MSTLTPISTPLDSLNVVRANQNTDGIANAIDDTELKTLEDTARVAKKFEALLIHNMLKAMRTTTLGDKASNERAMYDDMFDQHLSKVLTDSRGLGIATSISRQLNAQYGINDSQLNNNTAHLNQNFLALSNHPNTLTDNGKMQSKLSNLSHYQAIQSIGQSISHPEAAHNGAISIEKLNLSHTIEQQSNSDNQKRFVASLLPDAERNAARLGIEPNVIIAIAALETGWGAHVMKSTDGTSSNNLFGIKAHGAATSQTTHKTIEFVKDEPVTVEASFRRYDNKSASVNDFAEFLLSNPRYENALSKKSDKHGFLIGLQQAGYATDPQYANKAINVLKQIEAIRQDLIL